MAEDAGCMDLYRFAYGPWSNAAHGMWNHIGRFDSVSSSQPLHKHIQQPFCFECGPELDVVINATKYLDKAFLRVQDEFKLRLEFIRPYEWLMKRLEKMQAQQDDTRASMEGPPNASQSP